MLTPMLLLLCTLFILNRSALDDNACPDDDTTLVQIASPRFLVRPFTAWLIAISSLS
jgi:hypothetical protein